MDSSHQKDETSAASTPPPTQESISPASADLDEKPDSKCTEDEVKASSSSTSPPSSINNDTTTDTKDTTDVESLEKDLAKITLDVTKEDIAKDLAKTSLDITKEDIEKDTSKKTKKKKDRKESQKPSSILSNPTLEAVAEYINSGKCKNVIFMVGAGISTSAGIPDFRSPGTGLFDQLEKYNLPYPEAVFDIGFFNKNPKPFFHLARELFPGNFNPTPCHHFMKLVHDKGLLLRLYTQNIDGLERLCGVPAEKLIESHGTFHSAHCTNKKCKEEYTLEWMKNIVLAKEREDNIPRCEKCKSYVKPDIIFYGEMLPERFYDLIDKDFKKCDMLIIIGTSLTVQPFASLVEFVGSSVPRLMINLTRPDGGSSLISRFIPGHTSGLDFKSKSNVRNVFLKSDADAGCKRLAELLEWTAELELLLNFNVKQEDKQQDDPKQT